MIEEHLRTLINQGKISLTEPLDIFYIKDELEIQFNTFSSTREIEENLECIYYELKYELQK